MMPILFGIMSSMIQVVNSGVTRSMRMDAMLSRKASSIRHL